MTDSLMTPILDSIPGYSEARAHLAALREVPMPVTRGALTPADQLAADVVEALAAGEPVDLLDGAAAAIAEVGAVEVARQALTLARQRLEHTMAELKTSNPDHILSGLHTALTGLVEEVSALRPLREVTSEAGAIASDRTREFKHLQTLAPRYTAIRREQLRIMKEETGGDLGIPEVLFTRNLPDLFPLWAPWRSHGHLVHDQGTRTRTIRPPWPVPGDEGLDRGQHSASTRTFEADANRPEFLFWAIEAGAELWVPTLDEYATAGEEHFDRLARERRTEVIDEHWLDPGGINVGAPTQQLSHEGRMLTAQIRMADR